MSLGSFQIIGENLNPLEVEDICKALLSSSIKSLSLRKCTISDTLFNKLMCATESCKSLMQLNLNLGIVKNFERVKMLCKAIYANRSLKALFLHGSKLNDNGMKILCKVLSIHPNIVSLDIGDCNLTDQSIVYLAELLPPNGAKRGLQELTLSGNRSITDKGWVKFFITIASSNSLQKLFLDYTFIGETGINCLFVALASCRKLEILDIEGVGVSETAAQNLLHLVKNYPVATCDLVLERNPIKKSTKEAILLCLQENEEKRNEMFVESEEIQTVESTTENSATLSDSETTLSHSNYTISTNKGYEEASSLNIINTDTTSTVASSVSQLSLKEKSQEKHIEDLNSSQSNSIDFLSQKDSKPAKKSKKKIKGKPKKSRNLETRALPTPVFYPDGGSDISKHTDEEEEDMGTLLIGKTLPGYYAFPMRFTNNYFKTNNEISPLNGNLHAQNFARNIYSD